MKSASTVWLVKFRTRSDPLALMVDPLSYAACKFDPAWISASISDKCLPSKRSAFKLGTLWGELITSGAPVVVDEINCDPSIVPVTPKLKLASMMASKETSDWLVVIPRTLPREVMMPFGWLGLTGLLFKKFENKSDFVEPWLARLEGDDIF